VHSGVIETPETVSVRHPRRTPSRSQHERRHRRRM